MPAVNLDPYYGGTDVASHAHAGGIRHMQRAQTRATNHPSRLRTYLHTLLPVPLPCPMELVLQQRRHPVTGVYLPHTYVLTSQEALPTPVESISAQHLSIGTSGASLFCSQVPAHDRGGLSCRPHASWSKSRVRTYVRNRSFTSYNILGTPCVCRYVRKVVAYHTF